MSISNNPEYRQSRGKLPAQGDYVVLLWDYICNIMGDKLLLNFASKFQG